MALQFQNVSIPGSDLVKALMKPSEDTSTKIISTISEVHPDREMYSPLLKCKWF